MITSFGVNIEWTGRDFTRWVVNFHSTGVRIEWNSLLNLNEWNFFTTWMEWNIHSIIRIWVLSEGQSNEDDLEGFSQGHNYEFELVSSWLRVLRLIHWASRYGLCVILTAFVLNFNDEILIFLVCYSVGEIVVQPRRYSCLYLLGAAMQKLEPYGGNTRMWAVRTPCDRGKWRQASTACIIIYSVSKKKRNPPDLISNLWKNEKKNHKTNIREW